LIVDAAIIKKVPAKPGATEKFKAVRFKKVAETAAIAAAGFCIPGAAGQQTEGAEEVKGRE
jgi:hypothetical protein